VFVRVVRGKILLSANDSADKILALKYLFQVLKIFTSRADHFKADFCGVAACHGVERDILAGNPVIANQSAEINP
jgi:hypothetical protein